MLNRRLIFGALMQLLLFTGARAEDCGTLTHLKLRHVAITAAELVPAGSAGTPTGGEEIPVVKTDYRRVQGTSRPSADSDIRFERWVPAGDAWNSFTTTVGMIPASRPAIRWSIALG
jgi:hypothetical protein